MGSVYVYLFVMILLVLPNSVIARESDILVSSSGEFTVLSGYGITHRGYGETRTQVQTFDLMLRYGHFLSGELGSGHWYQGRHEVFLEIPYHNAVDHGGRSMVGASLFGSWKFTGFDAWTPYLFAGGGGLYVDVGLPTMGTRFNGTYQAGGGIQHIISRNLAVMGEYRYHHISNMNSSERNEPLNSSKFLIGVSFFR